MNTSTHNRTQIIWEQFGEMPMFAQRQTYTHMYTVSTFMSVYIIDTYDLF